MKGIKVLAWMIRGCFFLCGFVCCAEFIQADEILPPRTTQTQTTVITKTVPAAPSERPSVYDLEKWIVEEHTDPVRRALDVYKQKSKPKFSRRVWITDKKNGQKKILVEYAPRSSDDKAVFSPDEDFMYYLGVGPSGESFVYGISLLNRKKFSLGMGEGVRAFQCPDKINYVVVQQEGERSIFVVYKTTGQRVKTLTGTAAVNIEESLCR